MSGVRPNLPKVITAAIVVDVASAVVLMVFAFAAAALS